MMLNAWSFGIFLELYCTYILAFFHIFIRAQGLKYAKYLQVTLKHINFRKMEILHRYTPPNVPFPEIRPLLNPYF